MNSSHLIVVRRRMAEMQVLEVGDQAGDHVGVVVGGCWLDRRPPSAQLPTTSELVLRVSAQKNGFNDK